MTENGKTVKAAIAEYLEAPTMKCLSPKSVRCYACAARRFEAFLRRGSITTLKDISARDLLTYQADMTAKGLKDSSIELFMRGLRRFFSFLEKEQTIFVNPMDGIPFVAAHRTVQPVPTEQDIRILLKGPDVTGPIGLRDRAILEIAYSTGARLNELMGMKLSDLDLANGVVRVMGKGARERMTPLGKEAVRSLKQYLADGRPRLAVAAGDEGLWLGEHNKRLNYPGLRHVFRKYSTLPGLSCRIGPHSFRRACATHMLRNGAHPVEIQMLLGHRNLTSLRHYLAVSIHDLKLAHARSRLGR